MTRSLMPAAQEEQVKALPGRISGCNVQGQPLHLARYGVAPIDREVARTENLRASAAYRRIHEIYGDEAVSIPGSTKPAVVK